MDELKIARLQFTTEQTIKAIDFELDRIFKEHQRPGWTDWAIYGAIGAITWLIISFIETGNFSLLNVAQLYLTFRFVFDGLGLFNTIFHDTEFKLNYFVAFNRASNFITLNSLFLGLVISSLNLFIADFASNDIRFLQVIIVVIYFLFVICFQLYQFWKLGEDFPTPITIKKPSTIVLLLSFALTLPFYLVGMWAISGYFFAVYNRYIDAVNFTDFKLAGLLFAVSFLIDKLFFEPIPRKVKNHLISLRRHIVFGEIDIIRANFELKKIVGKLTPSEYLQDLYQECLENIDLSLREIDNSERILLSIQNEVIGDNVKDDSLLNSLTEKLKLVTNTFDILARRERIIENYYKKFNKELKRIKFFMRSFDFDLEKIEFILNKEYETVIKRFSDAEELRKKVIHQVKEKYDI